MPTHEPASTRPIPAIPTADQVESLTMTDIATRLSADFAQDPRFAHLWSWVDGLPCETTRFLKQANKDAFMNEVRSTLAHQLEGLPIGAELHTIEGRPVLLTFVSR